MNTRAVVSLAVGIGLLAAGACGEREPMAPAAAVSPLDNPAPPGSRLPALASRDDVLLLAWVEPGEGPSLRAAVLRSGAWSAPAVVARGPSILLDPSSPPAAAILSDGTLAVAWGETNPDGQYASDLRVSFSRDGGIRWSAPETPHRDGTATEHGFASLLPDAHGGVDVLWLDGRAFATSTYGEGGTRLYHASWNGAGFGEETLVDRRVCDCCRTALARPGGVLAAAYRDRGDDELRDISVSVDRGGAWSEPLPVHDDGWRLKACPTNGPALAASDGTTLVAWFTAAGAVPRVRVALARGEPARFGPPVVLDGGDPVGRVDAAALGAGGFAVSWLEKRGGRAEVRVRRVSDDGTLGAGAVAGTADAGRAGGTPRLAPWGAGAGIAWVEDAGDGRVRTARIDF